MSESSKNPVRILCIIICCGYTGPDSLEDSTFALGEVGCWFAPRPRHTKGNKMVLIAPFLLLASKGSVRKTQKASKYLLSIFVMPQ